MCHPTTVDPGPPRGAANLAALADFCRPAADLLAAVSLPPDVRLLAARDGGQTYAWHDAAGRLCWLGRTSMPQTRATALVAAFVPGSHNVLLYGFGQGAEARLLLDRLAPHQSVFVIEESPADVVLAMQLHDFADDLRRGRLLIFAGVAAWPSLESFLLANDGYVTPERVLSWPWFTPAEIDLVSRTLSDIATRVARSRAQRLAQLGSVTAIGDTGDPPLTVDRPKLLILSNALGDGAFRAAAELRIAASALNIPCRVQILDRPSTVHPLSAAVVLHEFRPTVVVLLDILPDELAVSLPSVPTFVLLTYVRALSHDWLRRLPETCLLGAGSTDQYEQVLRSGLATSRVLLVPPAASAGIPVLPPPATEARIAVIAEGAGISASAVGLHLASHCRLWDEATAVLRERCEEYGDEDATSIFDAAQKRLGIRVENDNVRQGLISRIRQVLGPIITRCTYCSALVTAGIPFDLYGGWSHDPNLAPYDRGPWPPPEHVPHTLARYGLIISIETSGQPAQAVFDALAAGRLVAVRLAGSRRLKNRSPISDIGLDSSGRLLRGAPSLMAGFSSIRDLLRILRTFQTTPELLRETSIRGAEHVRSLHTWTHRLSDVLEACQSQNARPAGTP